ncbi:ubiquitin-conjugating enzyme/RWD-like protein [Mycena leptocephala]|nr:ubiquitin-conjugating enzyme/RWD-like protein [Mycena leptocephala]
MHVHRVDMITLDKFPPRAEHPLLKQPVKAAANSVGMTGGGDDRMKRIMREIKAVVTDPHPNIDLYFNDSDMSFLKIILEAPNDDDNCPYKGGTFLLTCDLPVGYPRDPPEVRFVTFIMHPNVSKQGKVCIAELGRLWSSDITLKEIFSLVYGTLLTPDLENPLEIQASLKYYEDDGTYALAVAKAIATHASKTRAQWREELGE